MTSHIVSVTRPGRPSTTSNTQCNGGKPPVAGVTRHCDRKIPLTATVYAVAGHMHLLGRSIKIQVNPGTPHAKTVLDIPVWDFDNQGAKPVKPVHLERGDTVRVTCRHDQSLRDRLPAFKGHPQSAQAQLSVHGFAHGPAHHHPAWR